MMDKRLLALVPQVAWPLLAAGVVLREVATSALRDAEAFVEQDTHLFHDSIRDNLLIARPEATDAELEAACRAASAWAWRGPSCTTRRCFCWTSPRATWTPSTRPRS